MPVYLIIDMAIIDPEVYAEYVEKVSEVVEKYGGVYLVRGGGVVTVAGDWHPKRIILVEFGSFEQAQDFFASPDYLALAPLREQSASPRSIIVEGYELF